MVRPNNKAVTGYKAMYNPNTPIVNPTMTEASLVLTQQASWTAGKGNVSGYIKNGQAVITNSGGAAVWVPLCAGAGKLAGTATDFGEAYLGTRSAWTQLGAGQTLKVDIATNVAPVASFTETCTAGSCTFTSTTTDVDSEVGSFTYDWDFGDANSPADSTTGPVTQPHVRGQWHLQRHAEGHGPAWRRGNCHQVRGDHGHAQYGTSGRGGGIPALH